MDDQKLWHPLHHVYKKDKSTATTLLTLHEESMKAVDSKKQNILIRIDMSLVSYVVVKKILVKKLKI